MNVVYKFTRGRCFSPTLHSINRWVTQNKDYTKDKMGAYIDRHPTDKRSYELYLKTEIIASPLLRIIYL